MDKGALHMTLKGIKTILFTSNLSETSRIAFGHAALLATQLNARVVLLHVIERIPESYESRIVGLFGQDKWAEIIARHKQEAQHALIGKISSRQMARTVLSEFCRESGIDEAQCGVIQNEIVVKEGDVAETILGQAAEHACDLIIMGASKGLLSGTPVGHNIKAVLKRSKVPTMVVPAAKD
jgi:nucleotide-binding universal stress UspA family protein